MVRRFFVTEKVNEPPPSFAGAVAERFQLSEVPSLVKEGWTRHQEKCREATFDGADGVVRSTPDNRWLQRTTPSAPAKEASRHFLSGRIHPSFTEEGTSLDCNRSATALRKTGLRPFSNSYLRRLGAS